MSRDCSCSDSRNRQSLMQNQAAVTAAISKDWDTKLKSIFGSFNTTIKGILQGTTTWQKTMQNIWSTVLGGFVDMCLKMAEKWALKEIMQTAWRQFAFKITPFSSLAATKIARVQMLAQFAEMGMFPRSQLMREVGFDYPKDLMEDTKKELLEFGAPEPQKKSGKKK